MKKIMSLFFVVFVSLNGVMHGMEANDIRKLFEQEAYVFLSDHEKVIYLLEHDIPNCRTLYGATPLLLAARDGRVNDVQALLRAGSDVDAQTCTGCTVLQIASRWGHVKVVELLLFYGADIYRKNSNGYTALDFAKQGGNDTVIQILQKKLNEDALERKKARLAKRKTW